ncbi:MAG: polyprenyl synthetase family protein [Candidatus Methanoliparum thermophilum]|uniref:Polyprenyl synthetase family protein n=1 Tax=Methanoliparum thermophilum TaxID=2491083 RepID=A0A520KTM7_METT2|nr:polyprenyl synthetase family protein [Candidatus Methanoliparum sp. LAM-1]RZN65400.1 MAG: polyprenyl synthetase family protein [Candidatus Methanoliparum thermophilum]BDC35511.1 geranylgeranyl pyrophosphate synthase [Candidatus Methanoliparum sp. LAM-1]
MDIDFYKELIEDNYPKYFNGKEPEIHYGPMKELLARGGKRLRPILCMLTCDVFGGDVYNAIPTAIAIEFFHNFTLIHDDIQDNSLLRRGETTLHMKYGIPLVLNCGDGLYALSYQLLKDNEDLLGVNRAWRIFCEMIDMNVLLVEGQAMDIKFKRDKDLDEDGMIELMRKKTGVLFGAAAGCGAIIADVKNDVKESIVRFWENLGIVFQIRDDILNLTGKEEEYGKKIGDDIAEGKPTLILIHCLNNCNDDEREFIMNHLGLEYDYDKVKEVIDLFKKYGSINYAEKIAEKILTDSYAAIEDIDIPKKERMLSFANYFIKRNK